MSDKQVDRATPIIYALQTEFDLSDKVATAAIRLYTQYSEGIRESIQERYLERTAGACLFLAGKIHEEAPLAEELAAHIGVEKNHLYRKTRDIATELGLDPSILNDPMQYVERLCEELRFEGTVQTQAELIVEHAQEQGVTSGKSPRAVAAGAVYLSAMWSGKKTTQDAIADTIDVSNVTIRNRYQELAESDPPHLGSDSPEMSTNGSSSDQSGSATASFTSSVDWPGKEGPDKYVEPSEETVDEAIAILELNTSKEQQDVFHRAQTLFRLVQDAPQCDFATADRLDEWAVAGVCVAAEQLCTIPDRSQKQEVAELVNLDAQKLEGRCYKLRRAWESEVDA